jgi:succinate-semialdehyde dehydrogenase/glutarate-semialdehyde dehydrogenase
VAGGSWAARTAKERAKVLRSWHDLILEEMENLAMICTLECGKPLAESRGEVAYAASFIEWFAEEGKRAYGETIPSFANGKRILTIKQPVGVCAAITPWNFPLAMITRKVAPALAAGCSILVKPAEVTPLSALALEALAIKAGLPEGLFKVICTDDPVTVGKQFCDHAVIRKLSFTGSTAVGKLMLAQCASTVKRVSMELGGNAPFIIFDDADVDAAVDGFMLSKFRNAGQTCVCANRLLVQDSIHDSVVQKLTERVRALRVGSGKDDVQIGPLINQKAVDKVSAIVADAVRSGARLLEGGANYHQGTNFFQPTMLDNVNPSMEIAQTEIFGPVVPIIRFQSEADAISISNDTPYGLAAYFYARDIGRIWRVMESLEYGMVAVNEGALSSEVAPFGGIKQSGMGREGSRHGLDEYLEIKYALIGGLSR